MSTHTLLLTPWMYPHRIVEWHSAICLMVTGKIDVLESYEEIISSPSVAFPLPAVARLKRHVGTHKKGVKFSRVNIMTRDNFTCQYCGSKLPMRQLNYDHVVPSMKGGKTVWENIVTSCYPCNSKKGHRTLEQSGMKLRRHPYRPKTLPMSNPLTGMKSVPELWHPYIAPELLAHLG